MFCINFNKKYNKFGLLMYLTGLELEIAAHKVGEEHHEIRVILKGEERG
jgi:hypothetical protein